MRLRYLRPAAVRPIVAPAAGFGRLPDGAGNIAGGIVPVPLTAAFRSGRSSMQDIIWLSIIGGLAAATLAYARLCDRA